MMTLPLVRLSGPMHAQGVAHGRALKARIERNIALYFNHFRREVFLSAETVLQKALNYAPAVAQMNPGYYAAMEGVAEGAEVDFGAIAMLNMRYEILYQETSKIMVEKAQADGCTVFAVKPERTTNGHLLMGQNWDWFPGIQGALLHTTEADGLRTLAFTEAGIVGGKFGLNSAELGLVISGLYGVRDDWSVLHKPFHLRCYEILRQRSFDAALRLITDSPRPNAANFLLAQTPDRATDVEAAPEKHNMLGWQNGCVVHTNHFVDPVGSGIDEPAFERRHLSCGRHDRVRQLLEEADMLDIPRLQTIMRDHKNRPDGLCRHGDDPDLPAHSQGITAASVIIDLNAQTLYATDGPPCLSDYQKIEL